MCMPIYKAKVKLIIFKYLNTMFVYIVRDIKILITPHDR